MRCISCWQPHGSLLTTGAKPFETRGWATNFRGPILIHGAKRFVRSEWEYYLRFCKFRIGLAPLLEAPSDWSHLKFSPNDDGHGALAEVLDRDAAMAQFFDFDPAKLIAAVPLGALIGMVDMVDCIPVERMTGAQKIASKGFGDFSPGRFAWHVQNVRRFRTAIPCEGKQGFFYAHVDSAALADAIPVRQCPESEALKIGDRSPSVPSVASC